MTEEEIIVDLSGYLHRCRCCLEDCKGDTFVAVTSYVNERYFDFTSNSLMSSPKLSNKICTTCHSLLARYSVLKKTFVENQQRLEALLEVEDALKEANVKYETTEPSENVEKQQEQYTYIESIEPFDEEEWEAKPGEKVSHESIPISVPDFIFSAQQQKDPPKVSKPKAGSANTASKYTTKIERSPTIGKSRKSIRKSSKVEIDVCEFCSKQFHLRSTFNRHVARHYNYNRFICDRCGSRSHSKADLIKHLFTHLKNDPRVVFKCHHEGCSAVYRNRKSLTHHLKAFHEKARPFACTLCAKSFALRYMLTDHIRFTHQGQRPIICDVTGCGGRFTIKGHLQRHKRKVHKITC